MKALRSLVAAFCLATALAGAGHTQMRPRGGRPAGRAFFPGRAFPRAPVYGRQGPVYGRQAYGPQGFAPSAAYGPYGAPYRPSGPPGVVWRQQQEFLRQGVRQGQLAPLGRVIANIRQMTPGRQLDTGIEYLGPRMVYRVRWVTAQGRRVDYIVDAATGAILAGR